MTEQERIDIAYLDTGVYENPWRENLFKKLSSAALACLAQCWLAEEPETPMLLFSYIRKAIGAPRSIETNFADPDVLEFSRMWKRVDCCLLYTSRCV